MYNNQMEIKILKVSPPTFASSIIKYLSYIRVSRPGRGMCDHCMGFREKFESGVREMNRRSGKQLGNSSNAGV